MVWRGWERDPRNDPAATKALAAFEAAQRAELPAPKCYYAAQQAVAVVLATKTSLRIED